MVVDNWISDYAVTFLARCIMQDIIWGAVIIGIGLVMGGSIFLGQFSLFNMFFDGLGVFFVGKGALGVIGQQSSH